MERKITSFDLFMSTDGTFVIKELTSEKTSAPAATSAGSSTEQSSVQKTPSLKNVLNYENMNVVIPSGLTAKRAALKKKTAMNFSDITSLVTECLRIGFAHPGIWLSGSEQPEPVSNEDWKEVNGIGGLIKINVKFLQELRLNHLNEMRTCESPHEALFEYIGKKLEATAKLSFNALRQRDVKYIQGILFPAIRVDLKTCNAEESRFDTQLFIVVKTPGSGFEYRYKVVNATVDGNEILIFRCCGYCKNRKTIATNVCNSMGTFIQTDRTKPLHEYYYQTVDFLIPHARHICENCVFIENGICDDTNLVNNGITPEIFQTNPKKCWSIILTRAKTYCEVMAQNQNASGDTSDMSVDSSVDMRGWTQ